MDLAKLLCCLLWVHRICMISEWHHCHFHKEWWKHAYLHAFPKVNIGFAKLSSIAIAIGGAHLSVIYLFFTNFRLQFDTEAQWHRLVNSVFFYWTLPLITLKHILVAVTAVVLPMFLQHFLDFICHFDIFLNRTWLDKKRKYLTLIKPKPD